MAEFSLVKKSMD